jgi:pimeloyl-ACP methyl ester carboxylesterase
MSARSVFRGVFWSLIAVLFLIHVIGAWIFSSDLIADEFTPDPTPITLPTEGPDVEEVVYQSDIGTFDGWYVPARGSTWVIHVHGKGTTPSDSDFLFQALQDAGYPQLTITYRNDEGQPEDPSGYYQYGATEWADIRGAMEYAEQQGAESVVFSGIATGSSHILAFMFRHQLDDVKGIIMDSPNIDLSDTVDYNASLKDMPIIPTKVWPSVTWIAKFVTSLRIGVNWQSIDYIEDAPSKLRTPVLVHHGTDDLSVSVGQSIDFAQAAPDLVRLIQVPGAGHTESVAVAPEDYLAEVLGFLEEVG